MKVRDNRTGEMIEVQVPHNECQAVKLGQMVLWYINATRGSEPKVGMVISLGDKSLGILLLSDMFGTAVQGARFIDDPELKTVPESSKIISGAWDFTEETKWMRGLEARLAALESSSPSGVEVDVDAKIDSKFNQLRGSLGGFTKRLNRIESDLGVKAEA